MLHLRSIEMVYFAYGCPVTHRLLSAGAIDKVLLSKWGSDLLLVVTQRTVQLWGSNQHRIKLGELSFDEEDVTRYGMHVYAAWCSETRSIAAMVSLLLLCLYMFASSHARLCPYAYSFVFKWSNMVSYTYIYIYIQTDKGYLMYYSYSDSKEFPWSIELEIPIASIDIAMKVATNISDNNYTASGEKPNLAKVVGMYADAQSVTLVFQSGDFWRFDQFGKVCLLLALCLERTFLSGIKLIDQSLIYEY